MEEGGGMGEVPNHTTAKILVLYKLFKISGWVDKIVTCPGVTAAPRVCIYSMYTTDTDIYRDTVSHESYLSTQRYAL
jgi:hypothetical protein